VTSAARGVSETAWRNRIVGHGEEAPEQLLANPANWRLHPREQQQALAGALSEVGWVAEVLVNRTTGHVVDGHLRVDLAITRGEPSVPVAYVELNENEERLVLASLDPLAAMATAEKDALEALLAAIETDDAALSAMLADLADRNGIRRALPGDPDDVPRSPTKRTSTSSRATCGSWASIACCAATPPIPTRSRACSTAPSQPSSLRIRPMGCRSIRPGATACTTSSGRPKSRTCSGPTAIAT
jgi:hypothetical protein